MRKIGDYTYIWKLALVVVIGLCFTVAWYVFYSDSIPFPFYRKGNWLVVCLYIFVYILIGRQFYAFSLESQTRGNLIYTQLITIAFANVFIYCVISLIGRRWLSARGILLLSAVQAITAFFWAQLASHTWQHRHAGVNALLITDKAGDDALSPESLKCLYGIKCNETIIIRTQLDEDIINKINKYDVIILYCENNGLRTQILRYCYVAGKRVYIVATVIDILINGAQTINAGDRVLLSIDGAKLSADQKLIKRLVDIILSCMGLVIFSPVLALISIFVKLSDGGPPIYRQKRLTLDGKEFYLYKFRTMKTDAEADGIARLSSEGDSRITKIGAVLRRFRLDELPQLWNILKGDISIVGPRPERPELAEKYRELYPDFDLRLKVKGGLTGFAQIYGKYSTKPNYKLLMDLLYIENFSYLLDIRIFLMTLKSIFHKDSTK